MNKPRFPKPKAAPAIAILISLVAIFISTHSRRQDAAEAKAKARPSAVSQHAPAGRADFDFYLLAMSMHAAFCADGHDRKPECRTPPKYPLAIHGLWPEKLQPGAYPHDCPASALSLEPALERELAPFMPGMSSGLHAHEWRTHGGCSGLDDDAYFSRTLALAQHLVAALSAKLATQAGGETSADDLRSIANLFEPGLGDTLTFHCRTLRDAAVRGRPYLVEVRQCIDDDGPNGAPGTPLSCASVDRRDQGCGASFLIAQ